MGLSIENIKLNKETYIIGEDNELEVYFDIVSTKKDYKIKSINVEYGIQFVGMNSNAEKNSQNSTIAENYNIGADNTKSFKIKLPIIYPNSEQLNIVSVYNFIKIHLDLPFNPFDPIEIIKPQIIVPENGYIEKYLPINVNLGGNLGTFSSKEKKEIEELTRLIELQLPTEGIEKIKTLNKEIQDLLNYKNEIKDIEKNIDSIIEINNQKTDIYKQYENPEIKRLLLEIEEKNKELGLAYQDFYKKNERINKDPNYVELNRGFGKRNKKNKKDKDMIHINVLEELKQKSLSIKILTNLSRDKITQNLYSFAWMLIPLLGFGLAGYVIIKSQTNKDINNEFFIKYMITSAKIIGIIAVFYLTFFIIEIIGNKKLKNLIYSYEKEKDTSAIKQKLIQKEFNIKDIIKVFKTKTASIQLDYSFQAYLVPTIKSRYRQGSGKNRRRVTKTADMFYIKVAEEQGTGFFDLNNIEENIPKEEMKKILFPTIKQGKSQIFYKVKILFLSPQLPDFEDEIEIRI